MKDNRFKRNFFPDLEELAERLRKESGVYIDKLEYGDLLQVRTERHLYLFKMIDPIQRKIMLAAGNNPDWCPSDVLVAEGSSLDNEGGMVKVGWLGTGFRFCVGDMMLSSTVSIKINNLEICFPPFQKLN